MICKFSNIINTLFQKAIVIIFLFIQYIFGNLMGAISAG